MDSRWVRECVNETLVTWIALFFKYISLDKSSSVELASLLNLAAFYSSVKSMLNN